MADSGALEAIVSTLDAHTRDVKVQHAGLFAAGNIMAGFESPETRRRLERASAAGIERVAEAAKRAFPTAPNLQNIAANALNSLRRGPATKIFAVSACNSESNPNQAPISVWTDPSGASEAGPNQRAVEKAMHIDRFRRELAGQLNDDEKREGPIGLAEPYATEVWEAYLSSMASRTASDVSDAEGGGAPSPRPASADRSQAATEVQGVQDLDERQELQVDAEAREQRRKQLEKARKKRAKQRKKQADQTAAVEDAGVDEGVDAEGGAEGGEFGGDAAEADEGSSAQSSSSLAAAAAAAALEGLTLTTEAPEDGVEDVQSSSNSSSSLLATAAEAPEVMVEPVFTADGHTYERRAIEEWLSTGKDTSPMTGAKLEHLHLTPNHMVRGLCRKYADGE